MAHQVSEFAKAADDRLDVMINNADIMPAGRFEDLDVRAHLKVIYINTKGVVNGMHTAFPYLRSTPRSVVVNLAPASAIYGQAELASYSATKFFVRVITEALLTLTAYFALRVEHTGESPRRTLKQFWDRFPEFVLGFVAASIIGTLYLQSRRGDEKTASAQNQRENGRPAQREGLRSSTPSMNERQYYLLPMSGDIRGIRCVDPSAVPAWKTTLAWWTGGRLTATKPGE